MVLDVDQWASSTPSAGSWRVRGRLPNQSACEKTSARVHRGVLPGFSGMSGNFSGTRHDPVAAQQQTTASVIAASSHVSILTPPTAGGQPETQKTGQEKAIGSFTSPGLHQMADATCFGSKSDLRNEVKLNQMVYLA